MFNLWDFWMKTLVGLVIICTTNFPLVYQFQPGDGYFIFLSVIAAL